MQETRTARLVERRISYDWRPFVHHRTNEEAYLNTLEIPSFQLGMILAQLSKYSQDGFPDDGGDRSSG
jgi:hypothetical protein